MSEEQPIDPLAPNPDMPADSPEKYTRGQKVALTAGMCKQIGEDLGIFAKELVAHDTGDGYLISYDTVAILSAKMLRAKTGISALARIFEAAVPTEVSISETVASVKQDVKNTDKILLSLQEAVLSNKVLPKGDGVAINAPVVDVPAANDDTPTPV